MNRLIAPIAFAFVLLAATFTFVAPAGSHENTTWGGCVVYAGPAQSGPEGGSLTVANYTNGHNRCFGDLMVFCTHPNTGNQLWGHWMSLATNSGYVTQNLTCSAPGMEFVYYAISNQGWYHL